MIPALPVTNLFQTAHIVWSDPRLVEDREEGRGKANESGGQRENLIRNVLVFRLRLGFLLLFGFFDELAEFVHGGDIGGM